MLSVWQTARNGLSNRPDVTGALLLLHWTRGGKLTGCKLVASPAFAPGAGARPQSGVTDRYAARLHHEAIEVVAREGSAPSTTVCKTVMILFHHRAEIGCRGWVRTTTIAFKGRWPAG